ncbi:inter-alpha-trypsin inhibitor heavy chain H6 isoform X1 [Ranitomeya variabilis]|uniref:inter-alpha-trypsin inhibitor heavy chain H6 isoform X1 n=1 Tax=Ranitomeya variabilis TaxID=490064 RepID=UPI004055A8D0
MLLRCVTSNFIVSAMGNLSRTYFLLMMLLFLLDVTFTDQKRLAGPYQERFKRQIRAAKTELTISSLCIQSTIVSRYAFTKVQTLMVNPHAESKEAIFDLELPSSAFISNFTLTVNGKTHVAEVKEKHQAKKMYDEARRQGKTTAHVGTRDRETEKFRVSMSVEAGGEITFTLTYEELLRRQLGKYEHSISVKPGQIVQNLTVQVTISERTGIDYVRVLPLRSSRLLTNAVRGEAATPPSTEIEKSPHCARITFQPTPEEQASQSNSGIAADFVIQYDVTLKDLAGDVQIYNRYFVHYFAPRGLPAIQKNVIFVIDISGSMFGTKMKQTKSAMHVILSDLHRDDSFNIITFSDVVKVWKPDTSIQATHQNIKSAKEYVNKIEADGWTDINAAILAAASIFNQTLPKLERGGRKQKIPLIIFLTDGEATSGVTASTRILQNAQKALKGTISLFCLAFGEDADYSLMRRLSLENRGIARRIYEYSDATLQLKGFYDEIASPLLFDIELAYIGETAQNVTQTLFPNYFDGSELVVTGKLKSGSKNLQVRMTAHDQKEKISLENDINLEDNATQSSFGCSSNVDEIQWFVQRLWAYFTIQDLLQARFKANDTIARKILTEKATNLSLKYNFVTPVTSLIIVKPDDPDEPKTTPATTTSTTSMPSTATQLNAMPSHTTVSPPSIPPVKAKATTVTKLTKQADKTSRTPAKLSTTRPTTSSQSTISQVAETRGQAIVSTGTTTAGVLGKITTMASTSRSLPTTQSNFHHNSLVPPNTTPKPVPPNTTPKPVSPNTTPKPLSPNTTPKPLSPNTTPMLLSPHGTPKPYSPNTTPKPLSPNTTPKPLSPNTTPKPLSPNNTPMPLSPNTTPKPLSPNTTPKPLSPNTTPNLLSATTTPKLLSPTTTPRPDSSTLTVTSASPTISMIPSSFPNISTTEVAPEPVTGNLSASSVSPVTQDQWDGDEEEEAFHTIFPTSVPVNPTSLRLLLLPDDTELLPGTFSYSSFVESLNPPPVYSFFEEIADPIYEEADGYYDMEDLIVEQDMDYVSVSRGVPGLQTFMSSVDGDPHFVVNLLPIREKLCFTLDGRPGDILKLLSDPVTGITVNGHLMKAPLRIGHENRLRTYLDVITITINQPRINYLVNISLDSLMLKGEKVMVLPVTRPALIRKPKLTIKISPSSNISVWIGRKVELLILFHRYQHPTYLQMNHLGFYIVRGDGLSSTSGGLLGQFQNAHIDVTEKKPGNEVTFTGKLRRGNHTAPATLVVRSLKDSTAHTHMSKCWLVKHTDIEKILEGNYLSYVASDFQEM